MSFLLFYVIVWVVWFSFWSFSLHRTQEGDINCPWCSLMRLTLVKFHKWLNFLAQQHRIMVFCHIGRLHLHQLKYWNSYFIDSLWSNDAIFTHNYFLKLRTISIVHINSLPSRQFSSQATIWRPVDCWKSSNDAERYYRKSL